ncbi:hypothetical protein EOI86_23220 [Hwanghaeella grinnelliae]|uniref:Uncharacterized protein n=1 Tax=Hwanghaeella grinnelliae TaxID=2500179 RepID=A0A3S2WPH8_9PROT|nr:hypothetical protein [Hwanghaeella grinnelliae]RVU34034.1 hypothetical protein EOI86_23220 [Hwanghaeella grinnelliae]
MNWFLTTILCVVLVEVVMALPFLPPLRRLSNSSQSALRTVMAKSVSDHWKEKAMAAYAQRTFGASLKIAFLLAVVLSIAGLLVVGFDWVFSGFQSFILTWIGIAASVVAASLYVWVRKAIFHG